MEAPVALARQLQHHLSMDDFAGAARVLRQAVDLGGDSQTRVDLGYCLLWGGHAPAARGEFHEALKVNPFDVRARLGMALGLLVDGALVEAIDAARRASIADPTAGTPNATAALVGARNGADAVARFYAAAQAAFADVQPPTLTAGHLAHSRVVPSREDILPFLPKGGICAEVGTQTGYFARQMTEQLQPSCLHVYDICFESFDRAYFEPLVAAGRVVLHEGDSSTLLAQAEDESFDVIYVDGDHRYEGVARDLAQARRKIKREGWILCNDYTAYSPLEGVKYGVYRAVNELCLEHGFEIVYLGLHPWGYHDVALRRRRA